MYYTPLWKQGAGTDMHSAIVSGNDIAREASDSRLTVIAHFFSRF